MESRIRFGELRTVISRIDRLSICMKDTLQYENFDSILQVPEKYDDCLVYGIGMISSEFSTPGIRADMEQDDGSGIYFDNCIEIMLYRR